MIYIRAIGFGANARGTALPTSRLRVASGNATSAPIS